MTVLEQTVVTCDHDSCDAQVSTTSKPTGAALLGWLDSSGWVQFHATRGETLTALSFCPTHLVDLRQYFGDLDASAPDGLTLTQGRSA